MIIIPPSLISIGGTIGALITSIGGTIIGDKIASYLKNRFKIFQKEYEKTEGKDRIIILQRELLGLKNFQIELLEDIINGDYEDTIEKEMLLEFKNKTIFITELEKLLS